MVWLPREFDGVRAPEAALADIGVIAAAPHRRSHTHLVVEPELGEECRASGALSVEASPAGHVRLKIDGQEIIELALGDIRGAWLHTTDGADYYSLRIDPGSVLVVLSDAYNGL